jgi:hypothetical protein
MSRVCFGFYESGNNKFVIKNFQSRSLVCISIKVYNNYYPDYILSLKALKLLVKEKNSVIYTIYAMYCI